MNKKLFTFFIAIILGGIVYFSIMIGKPFSELFNDIGVGLGALLAGLGGLIAFWDWSENKINQHEFPKFRNAYPREKLTDKDADDGFRLLRFSDNGHIFIYDLVTKQKFWIKNMSTYYELGYKDDKEGKDWKNITTEEIEKYRGYKRGRDVVAP